MRLLLSRLLPAGGSSVYEKQVPDHHLPELWQPRAYSTLFTSRIPREASTPTSHALRQMAFVEEDLVPADILTYVTHVLSRMQLCPYLDHIAHGYGVFDHHHRISAFGHMLTCAYTCTCAFFYNIGKL